MSLNENAAPIDLNDKAVVDLVLNDKELRSLAPGSEEFTSEVNRKMEEKKNPPASDVPTNEDKSHDPEESKKKEDEDDSKNASSRIRQLRDEREAARKERDELRKQLEDVKVAKSEEKKEVSAPSKVENVDYSKGFTKPKPDMNTFKTVGEYADALTDWKLEQRDFIQEQKARESTVKSAGEKLAETWNTREAAAKEKLTDYADVVTLEGYNYLFPKADSSVAFLADSEHGPEVLYKLFQDDAKVEEFKKLPEYRRTAMLGALEAEVKSKTSTTKGSGNDTAKPAPPPKLPGGRSSKVSPEPDLTKVTDFAEYNRIRSAQEKARRAAK